MNQDKYLTISSVTKYLKFKFDTDEHLRTVFLKGEISNFKAHTTGHFYFSLKDESSKINAIMFSTNAKKINFVPTEGMKVLVAGRISVYEATGGYQIYVEQMEQDGLGSLYVAFEKLKQDLAKEGLFDPAHKKPIPKIPTRIGIVTAPTGAAIKDILSTIKRRFPICETILFPALVQGENAASDIAAKIDMASHYELDTLIVGRGGGSIEDLWPFNEEIVARAIYYSPIPIISAVGHEIDYTISDYVSDLRAPTPTGAAEIAVPNMINLLNHLEQLKIRLKESILKKIKYNKLYLDSLKNSYVIKTPMVMYENRKQKIDLIHSKLSSLILHQLAMSKKNLEHIKNNHILLKPQTIYDPYQKSLWQIIEKLELLNPLSVLKRGYTLTYQNGHLLKSVLDIKDGPFELKFQDGVIMVEKIKMEE